MRSVLLACLLSFAASISHAQDSIRFVERTALGGKIALLAPEGFGPLSAEILQAKYPGERRPTEVLTNESASINIVFSHTHNAVTPAQLPEAHAAMERQIRSRYPTARWSRSELVTRGNRGYIMLDFWSPTIDGEVRNIMLATPVDGRILVVSFNVTRVLEPRWGAAGERIMNSVRVVE